MTTIQARMFTRLVCMFFLLPGCFSVELQQRMAKLETSIDLRVKLMELEIKQISLVLGKSRCTPELSSFLESIKDCDKITCKEFNIRASNISLNYAEGQFLHDIRLTEHQVVFLEDPYQINDQRLSQLVRFIDVPALPTSYYLFISPVPMGDLLSEENRILRKQLSNRQRAVREIIEKYDNHKGIKEISYPIQIDYSRKAMEKIRKDAQRDAPLNGEPSDLFKSIWVLRVSC